jgi:hypothetical protein
VNKVPANDFLSSGSFAGAFFCVLAFTVQTVQYYFTNTIFTDCVQLKQDDFRD